jgi:glycosyltransferase involved in cell wall biosynthesis
MLRSTHMPQKLISVITVTKNCALTLATTFDSISAIKTEEIEYIVIDGDSTDSTLKVVAQYANIIDSVVSEADSGIYDAMNKGVTRASGKYVLFTNGDDELVPDGFASAVMLLRNHSADIVCMTTLIAGTKQSLKAKPWQLLFFNSIPHPSTFVKTNILRAQPFRIDLKIAADYDFFLKAYLVGSTFSIVPLVTALHQRGGASGDVARSTLEVDLIRQYRLGWRYPLVNWVHYVYRRLKPCLQYCRLLKP